MESELLKKLLEYEKVRDETLDKFKQKEWMNIHEAADYLSLSIRSLYRLINKNKIPYKYIPGTKKIRFKKRHLDIWIETGKNVMTDRVTTRMLKEINKINDT